MRGLLLILLWLSLLLRIIRLLNQLGWLLGKLALHLIELVEQVVKPGLKILVSVVSAPFIVRVNLGEAILQLDFHFLSQSGLEVPILRLVPSVVLDRAVFD